MDEKKKTSCSGSLNQRTTLGIITVPML